MIAFKERSEQTLADTIKRLDAEAEKRAKEAVAEVHAEADSRVAAAEQRAAEAEAQAEEARGIAVRIEAEIEERVMQGTEEVRRQADDRVREMVAKFEGEAEEAARARAKDQLEAESDRIRKQAEQREERARRAAEEEIKASAGRARREALAAAEETAPDLGRAGRAAHKPDQRLPDLLGTVSSDPPCARFGSGTPSAASWSRSTRPSEVGIYACGPTVYSRIHIGNARPFVVFSLFARFLRSRGLQARSW